jgi:hypothetical protein
MAAQLQSRERIDPDSDGARSIVASMIPATRYGRPHRRVEAHPFAPEKWRPLRLVADDANLSAADLDLLEILASEDELDLWHTAGARLPRLDLGTPFDAPFQMAGSLTIETTTEHSAGIFGVYGTERLAARAADLAAAGEGDQEDILRTLLFAAASDESDADGFMTTRASLFAPNPRSPVVTGPADAFALIGLAFRANGNPSLGSDLWDMRPSSSWFHFLLGRELLREGWPWFGGVVAHSEVHREESIVYLAQTALERFQRVLQIRDRIHILAKGEMTGDRPDELTFELETLLLFLSASFDTLARVAHVVYLSGSYEKAGWRNDRWLQRLHGHAPELVAVVAEGARGFTRLQIIGALRNTIHGESLRAAGLQQGGETSRFIRIGAREEERLRRRLDQLGEPLSDWGIAVTGGSMALTADRFVERLIPEVVTVMNDLMAHTDTSLLPDAGGSPLLAPLEDRLPSGDHEWFRPDVRARIRLLGGF